MLLRVIELSDDSWNFFEAGPHPPETFIIIMSALSTVSGFGRSWVSGIVLLTSLGAAACTGVLGATGKEEGGATGDNPFGPGAAGEKHLGTKGIHRLNTAEYNATVADVLGTSLQPANANWRGGELEGFDNMASVLGIDATQYERYLDAAETLVADVLSNQALRDKLIPCSEADDDACIEEILETSGLRIFRRPLAAEEVGTYAKVYEAARGLGDDHYASAGLMLQALLSSAEFLYRIETDPDPTSTEEHPLNPYELASRLSYFLWSSAPDDALLASAADGSLTSDDTLRETVTDMLADPKAQRFVLNFAGQWLGARRVTSHPTAPDVYPDWTPDVASAAAEEMYQYFAEFLYTDRSWLDFLQLDLNFVNPALAQHYGMPAPAGGAQRVENYADERFGFLGLAGFLAISSFDRRTSPTLRGKWVLVNLMCTEPPPPPAGVDVADFEAEVDGQTQNVRERLEQHRADPQCAACHSMFDPFGMALEQFDGVGQFRTTYAEGDAIDPSTDLFGEPFSGLEGTADIVTSHPDFAPCVAEKMLTYAVGRPLEKEDLPYVEEMAEEWLNGDETPTLTRAIQGLVLTDTFRKRRGEGE